MLEFHLWQKYDYALGDSETEEKRERETETETERKSQRERPKGPVTCDRRESVQWSHEFLSFLLSTDDTTEVLCMTRTAIR